MADVAIICFFEYSDSNDSFYRTRPAAQDCGDGQSCPWRGLAILLAVAPAMSPPRADPPGASCAS